MWQPSLLWWAAAGDFTAVVTARALQDGEEEEERERERMKQHVLLRFNLQLPWLFLCKMWGNATVPARKSASECRGPVQFAFLQ